MHSIESIKAVDECFGRRAAGLIAILVWHFLWVNCISGEAAHTPEAVRAAFAGPPQFKNDLGQYKSPLIFNDGITVEQLQDEVIALWERWTGAE